MSNFSWDNFFCKNLKKISKMKFSKQVTLYIEKQNKTIINNKP